MDAAVVDLFCGIGGLSYGFKTEGFNVIAGLDIDRSCKFAFEENVEAYFAAGDISQVSGDRLNRVYNKAGSKFRVLVGCAPCTPFSLYVGRYKKNEHNDPRWQLLRQFARLALATKPDVISMENVPRLTRHNIFTEFVQALEDAGYTVSYNTLRADHYGVPQRRSRLVLFASLHGKIAMPKPTHLNRPRTVRDAIGALPKISAGQAHAKDRLHFSRGLTTRNLRRIRATSEGGGWQDWGSELKLACHKRAKGKTFRSVYGRMVWDAPSPVITTQCLGLGNGRFGHPAQDRAISIREAALLQSFPKSYVFVPPKIKINQLALSRQIGNAVPVKLGQVIAKAIKQHLTSL